MYFFFKMINLQKKKTTGIKKRMLVTNLGRSHTRYCISRRFLGTCVLLPLFVVFACCHVWDIYTLCLAATQDRTHLCEGGKWWKNRPPHQIIQLWIGKVSTPLQRLKMLFCSNHLDGQKRLLYSSLTVQALCYVCNVLIYRTLCWRSI